MADLFDPNAGGDNGDVAKRIEADIAAAGGPLPPEPELAGQIGVTMFDLPGSEDHTVTVLLARDQLERAPSQAMVRIKSRGDGRSYLGIVTAGPFAEPDSLRGDSNLLKTLAVRGGSYQPPFHGRVQITLLGEELEDGALVPPRLRPLPSSPVIPLDDQESANVLKAQGDLRFGVVVGYKDVVLGVPSDRKDVLPRHTAILGTTGGGKSNTVARLVQQAQAAGMSVIVLDVEGEYTRMHLPTTNRKMQTALAGRGLTPAGLCAERMMLFHLIGRDSANPEHPHLQPFSLQFGRLSPYAAAEILGLSDAQMQRFMKAYDVAKELLREFDIFPKKGNAEQERLALEFDEFERGYPRLALPLLLDVVAVAGRLAEGSSKDKNEADSPLVPVNTPWLRTRESQDSLRRKLLSGARPDHAVSWRALLGRLGRLNRLKVFDVPKEVALPLTYQRLLQPGVVSVLDLSDSGISELNNLVIADLLRGVHDAQDDALVEYERAKRSGTGAPPPRVLVVIEEAHEFLSEERIEKMKILFEQVARIAKRGRKRWLGLVFVTQLPQHLPRQVFGLVNSYVLHKITDPQVVSNLRRSVSGIDAGLWDRLPGLAPGQAIVSFPHMARPLLASIDPSPAELRLVD
jgi:DNA helicase HerA-like ATPase